MALDDSWAIGGDGSTMATLYRQGAGAEEGKKLDGKGKTFPVEGTGPENEPKETTSVGEFIDVREPERQTSDDESDVDRELGEVFKDDFQKLREAATPPAPKLEKNFPRNHSATQGVPGVKAASDIGPGDFVSCEIDGKSKGTVLNVSGATASVLWETGEKTDQSLGDLQKLSSLQKQGSAFNVGDRVKTDRDLRQTGWDKTISGGTAGTVTDVSSSHTAFGTFEEYEVAWETGEKTWVGNAHLLLSKASRVKQAQDEEAPVEQPAPEQVEPEPDPSGQVQACVEFLRQRYPAETLRTFIAIGGGAAGAAKLIIGNDVEAKKNCDQTALTTAIWRMMNSVTGNVQTAGHRCSHDHAAHEKTGTCGHCGTRTADLSKTLPEQAAIEVTGFPSEKQAGRKFSDDEKLEIEAKLYEIEKRLGVEKAASLRKTANGVGRIFFDEHGTKMMVVKIVEMEDWDPSTGQVVPTQVEYSCPEEMAMSLLQKQEQVRQDSIAMSQHYPILSSQEIPDEERRRLFSSAEDAIVATSANIHAAFRQLKGKAYLEAAHIERTLADDVDEDGRIVEGSVDWRVHLVAPRHNRRTVVSVRVPIKNGEPEDPTEMVMSTGARHPISEAGVVEAIGVREEQWNPSRGRRHPEVIRSQVPD